MSGPATLHMLCGKIASGKTTLAARLSGMPNTVLLKEDVFLSLLYPDEIRNLDDYRRCSGRLKKALGPHIVELLRAGVSVVLDFQANTPAARGWMRSLFEAAGAAHQLHYLRADDATCKERLAKRNAEGAHEYQVSEADFDLFTSHFVTPDSGEGFNLVLHEQ